MAYKIRMSACYTVTHRSIHKLVKVLHSYIFEQIHISNDIHWFHPKEETEARGKPTKRKEHLYTELQNEHNYSDCTVDLEQNHS